MSWRKTQNNTARRLCRRTSSILVYPDAIVILRGWRLELLVGPLVSGRVARIHAEKHLGTLIIEEAWVSEIHVIPYDDPSLLEGRPEIPITTKKKK